MRFIFIFLVALSLFQNDVLANPEEKVPTFEVGKNIGLCASENGELGVFSLEDGELKCVPLPSYVSFALMRFALNFVILTIKLGEYVKGLDTYVTYPLGGSMLAGAEIAAMIYLGPKGFAFMVTDKIIELRTWWLPLRYVSLPLYKLLGGRSAPLLSVPITFFLSDLIVHQALPLQVLWNLFTKGTQFSEYNWEIDWVLSVAWTSLSGCVLYVNHLRGLQVPR